ncbi:hypothetical protein [Nocardioides antri]|uniref:Uncharacterized protein n=1 Tax=Nocardioides antri TaxID=2607659 RepID=A0A5B1M7B8_9ACTN|nr:hypothetical protein [Nocardioides antri]KAA1428771.1 hypothetical protein F0U47_00685 [Nocardioides antri]
MGRAFVDGCDDTDGSSSTLGCSTPDDEVETPHEDIGLRVTQGARRWELGREDAGTADNNQLGHVSWTVTIPDDLNPGRATLEADNSDPLRIVVR